MKIELNLFGALRQYTPAAAVTLEVADDARVADVRTALRAHAEAYWPGFHSGLLARSAFASETTVLREGEPVPADGRMAVLPPVSGG
ncbi:MoaD/ThiS family protein [Vulcaniibacterium gelatinicum]|uniref:MoaD/ThiS family protein n=1 Tax=Vulcaniibacterium gelatinicum TaxID=2598725 RepID=UPI0011CB1D3E|nr:MoaD/ThiS family protein [Vulcaniibacterium gelatinicum]